MLLKSDHRKVKSLFDEYEKAEGVSRKSALARQICQELVVHTLIEEEIFYPACREKGVESDLAQVEHDGAKVMIADIVNGSPDDAFYDPKVNVLLKYIKHHVAEEDKPRSGIFASATKAGLDLTALGAKVSSRKQELQSEADELLHEPLKAPAIHLKNISINNRGGTYAAIWESVL